MAHYILSTVRISRRPYDEDSVLKKSVVHYIPATVLLKNITLVFSKLFKAVLGDQCPG